jgi:hypothetical protein
MTLNSPEGVKMRALVELKTLSSSIEKYLKGVERGVNRLATKENTIEVPRAYLVCTNECV